MADIEYRCTECDTARTISEFADASKIKCIVCGGKLRNPADPPQLEDENSTPVDLPAATASRKLKVSKSKPQLTHITDNEQTSPSAKKRLRSNPDDDTQRDPLNLHPRVKRKTKGANHTLLAFLVFALTGSVAGYLRYALMFDLPGSTNLPLELIGSIISFSWLGLLVLNVLVVIKAMSENMFQGILCLFLPGWSLVYLLFMSDDFYLRALVFGCLIGIGIDGGIQLWDGVLVVSNHFKAFIASGGG